MRLLSLNNGLLCGIVGGPLFWATSLSRYLLRTMLESRLALRWSLHIDAPMWLFLSIGGSCCGCLSDKHPAIWGL